MINISKTKFCPNCGKELESTTKFCPEWGTIQQKIINNSNGVQSNISNKYIVIIGIAACFFILGIGLSYFILSQNQDNDVKNNIIIQEDDTYIEEVNNDDEITEEEVNDDDEITEEEVNDDDKITEEEVNDDDKITEEEVNDDEITEEEVNDDDKITEEEVNDDKIIEEVVVNDDKIIEEVVVNDDDKITEEEVNDDEITEEEIKEVQRMQLSIDNITSSSYFIDDDYNHYIAENTIDSNIITGWVGGNISNNIGQWIEYRLGASQPVEEIQIYNGNTNTKQNNMGYASIVELSFSNGEYFKYPLGNGWNTLILPYAIETTSMRITVLALDEPYHYNFCISEVLIFNKTDKHEIYYSPENPIIKLPTNSNISSTNTIKPFAIVNEIEIYRIEDISVGDIINGFRVTSAKLRDDAITEYMSEYAIEPLEDLFLEIYNITHHIGLHEYIYLNDKKLINYNYNSFIILMGSKMSIEDISNLSNLEKYIGNDDIMLLNTPIEELIKNETREVILDEEFILSSPKTIKLNKIIYTIDGHIYFNTVFDIIN